jgi:hypothetical protein
LQLYLDKTSTFLCENNFSIIQSINIFIFSNTRSFSTYPDKYDQVNFTSTSQLQFFPYTTYLTLRKQTTKIVGSGVVVAVSRKMAVFWFVAPCSLVENRRRFTST